MSDAPAPLGALDTPLQGVDLPGPRDEGSVTAALGFWLFLLSDVILFAGLFAAYGVLSGATAAGPSVRQIVELPLVGVETGCLLTSSFVCGLAMVAADRELRAATFLALAGTFSLGLVFLGCEASEFARLVGQGAGPARSAALSSFFALVGTHGAHVAAGLAWLSVLAARLGFKGFTLGTQRGLMLFGLFWHLLDIVWVGVLSVVYLIGAAR